MTLLTLPATDSVLHYQVMRKFWRVRLREKSRQKADKLSNTSTRHSGTPRTQLQTYAEQPWLKMGMDLDLDMDCLDSVLDSCMVNAEFNINLISIWSMAVAVAFIQCIILSFFLSSFFLNLKERVIVGLQNFAWAPN